jgi:predicted Zn-dependent protease
LLGASVLALTLVGCAATTEPAPVEDRSVTGAAVPTSESGVASDAPSRPAVAGTPAAAPEAATVTAAMAPALPASAEQPPIAPARRAAPRSGTPPAAPPSLGNPATVALLQRANAQHERGDSDGAVATLERALNIESANPWLWHRLAQIRLQQSRLDAVAPLAARSNSLAQGDTDLMASNWELIARAHAARGEAAAAEAARRRVEQLRGR